MDPAEKVVHAIVRATRNPQKEIAVGDKAKAFVASNRITQTLTENIAGAIAHDQFVEEPPPAPTGSRALHEPMASGTGVEGGVRARIEEENGRRSAEARSRILRATVQTSNESAAGAELWSPVGPDPTIRQVKRRPKRSLHPL
jgi:hypothetical protein